MAASSLHGGAGHRLAAEVLQEGEQDVDLSHRFVQRLAPHLKTLETQDERTTLWDCLLMCQQHGYISDKMMETDSDQVVAYVPAAISCFHVLISLLVIFLNN